MNKDISTEEKILEAARQVFYRKGMDGARMQEIADEAGINKALLHYYFRSKEKLFEAVFQEVIKGFFRSIEKTLYAELPLTEKAEFIVERYITMIESNPFVPQFIISEINRNPQMLRNVMMSEKLNPQTLVNVFGKPNDENQQSKYDPRQMVISLLGMVIFPYAARNLLQMIYFDGDEAEYSKFLTDRKEFVKTMILKMLTT
ncbi:TetR/AcrR family transcriptional regulator [Parabacteroides sp. FAFU027]|uniref:TetR/AcrR family transcriptional regulator n=1 Tax=Parabacteroides sp. FAFU027 TaxID=2922715 RepID=UPI001FAEAF2A|nr:TetR/AcrR family transcriptional regulator [Parabacteroides sp. FAFU027]